MTATATATTGDELPLPLLLGMIALGGLAEFIYGPSLVEVAADFGASVAAVQATVHLNLAGFALGTVVFGLLADRLGCRRSYLLGVTCFGLGALLCALSPSLEMLAFARTLQGLGGGSGAVIARALIRERFEVETQQRLAAYAVAALSVSPLIGPVLGGFATEHLGWRANFAVLLGLALVVGASAARRIGPDRRPSPTPAPAPTPITDAPASLLRRTARILATPAFTAHLLVGGLLTGIAISYQITAPFLLIAELGLSESAFGLWQLPVVLGFMAGAALAGRVLRGWPGTRIVLAGLLVVLSLALTSLALGRALPLSLALVIAPMAVMNLGAGMAKSQTAAQAMLALDRDLGLGSAVLGAAQMLLAAGLAAGLSLLELRSQIALAAVFVGVAVVLLLVYGAYVSWVGRTARGAEIAPVQNQNNLDGLDQGHGRHRPAVPRWRELRAENVNHAAKSPG